MCAAHFCVVHCQRPHANPFRCIMDGIVAFQVAEKGSITIILFKHFSIDFLWRWSTQCPPACGCARNELGCPPQRPFAGIYYECCLHINVNTVGQRARFPFNRSTRDAGIKRAPMPRHTFNGRTFVVAVVAFAEFR